MLFNIICIVNSPVGLDNIDQWYKNIYNQFIPHACRNIFYKKQKLNNHVEEINRAIRMLEIDSKIVSNPSAKMALKDFKYFVNVKYTQKG